MEDKTRKCAYVYSIASYTEQSHGIKYNSSDESKSKTWRNLPIALDCVTFHSPIRAHFQKVPSNLVQGISKEERLTEGQALLGCPSELSPTENSTESLLQSL